MYVCLFAYNSGTVDCLHIFRVALGFPRDDFGRKIGESWVGAGKLAFFVSRENGRPCATARRWGTGHWTLDRM